MDYSYIDIVLLLPLLWGAYKGFVKGFILEVASLIALIVGLYGAAQFSNLVSPYIQNALNVDNQILPIISFIITFITIAIVIFMLAKVLEKFANMLALGFVNKAGGLIFGALKAGLIWSMIIFFMNALDQKIKYVPETEKEKSILYDPMLQSATTIIDIIGGKEMLEGYVNPENDGYKEEYG